MAWGKAGSTTLSSAGDSVDIGTITASETMNTMFHVINNGSTTDGTLRFNNNSSANYPSRWSNNGGSENTATNHTYTLAGYWGSEDTLGINYICNVSGEEKLSIMHAVARGTAGAGNAPNRREAVGKFTETTGQITDVEGFNEQAGSFDTDTNLTVLGSEITPAAAIGFAENAQVGSRAEITDSKKIYNFSDTSKSKLKAYYHFEDNVTNAQTTGDGLGSSANMSVTGATYVTGKVGSKAISFDGTNDYTTVGSSTSQFNFMHNTTHEWTVSFWFKSSDMSSLGMIFTTMKDTSSQYYGVAIRRNNSSTMAVNFGAGTNQNRLQDTKAGFSTDGNWHHIVITAKASDSTNSLEYWEDGVSLGTTSNSGKVFSDTDASFAPYIGQANSDQYLDGALDELSIWNRRLTDSEISTLYNSGTGQVIADGMSKSWEEIGT
jgi:hypothetical protein